MKEILMYGISLIIFIFLLGFILRFLLNKIKSTKSIKDENIDNEKLPYKAKWEFMTKAELSFYKQLEVAVGDKYYVIPQVQLSKILWAPMGKYENKIDRKSIDFALFSKPDFKFVKAIELNDYTHDTIKRKERDEFVNKAMKVAGLELQTVDDRESFKPF